MEFCIVNADGIIENIIVADEEFAESIGALPYYAGAGIGLPYAPPEPEPEEPETEEVTTEDMALAILEGVNEV